MQVSGQEGAGGALVSLALRSLPVLWQWLCFRQPSSSYPTHLYAGTTLKIFEGVLLLRMWFVIFAFFPCCFFFFLEKLLTCTLDRSGIALVDFGLRSAQLFN